MGSGPHHRSAIATTRPEWQEPIGIPGGGSSPLGHTRAHAPKRLRDDLPCGLQRERADHVRYDWPSILGGHAEQYRVLIDVWKGLTHGTSGPVSSASRLSARSRFCIIKRSAN